MKFRGRDLQNIKLLHAYYKHDTNDTTMALDKFVKAKLNTDLRDYENVLAEEIKQGNRHPEPKVVKKRELKCKECIHHNITKKSCEKGSIYISCWGTKDEIDDCSLFQKHSGSDYRLF